MTDRSRMSGPSLQSPASAGFSFFRLRRFVSSVAFHSVDGGSTRVEAARATLGRSLPSSLQHAFPVHPFPPSVLVPWLAAVDADPAPDRSARRATGVPGGRRRRRLLPDLFGGAAGLSI